MNLYILSVFDSAVEAFGRPFCVNHPNQALRQFTDEVNNPESEIFKHAGDYELWLLGSLSDQEGQIQPGKERIARAIDLKKA